MNAVNIYSKDDIEKIAINVFTDKFAYLCLELDKMRKDIQRIEEELKIIKHPLGKKK